MILQPFCGGTPGLREGGDRVRARALRGVAWRIAAAAALIFASCGDAPRPTGDVRVRRSAAWRGDDPWENGLGMPLAPVAGLPAVHFAVWPTRVRDFRAFVDDTEHNDGYEYRAGAEPTVMKPDGWAQRGWTYGWDNPGFHQEEDHPVTCVSWEDAEAFCAWLTRVEQAVGRIGPNRIYRLPTDEEWDRAVGIASAPSGVLSRWFARKPAYPWGLSPTPPAGWGNYAGEEARIDTPYWWPFIPGYHDGHPRTSPVGAFGPKHGALCDLGGNVWEWIGDAHAEPGPFRRMRGGSWSNVVSPSLLSSGVEQTRAGFRRSNIGFRVVLVTLWPESGPGASAAATHPRRDRTVEAGACAGG